MRRVADEGEARIHELLGDGQVERVGEPFSGQRNLPEEITEAGAQHLQVFGIIQRFDLGGAGGGFAPDDGRAVAGQGQDRQRPRGHEELMRDAVMRFLMRQ